MNKLLTYTALFCTVFSGIASAADEMDNMLFGPAPKITAGQKVITPASETKNKLLQPVAIDDSVLDLDNLEPALDSSENVSQPGANVPPPPPAIDMPVDSGASLTETLKNAGDSPKEEKTSPLAGTWVEKLAQKTIKNENASDDTNEANLENMLNKSKNSNRRSNASVFDISGVMLRMSRNQADAVLLKRGFKLTSQKFEIPNFIKWRYEEQCRNAGVIGYERLASCVVKAAKDNNHQYVESEKYVKFDTKEEININFTSNFTNNKVFKITYQSMTPRAHRGSGAKAQYLRDIKIYDFWRKINQKYGVPDNKDEVIWGMGGNKPYMKASTGFLLLEDPMLRELDYTRMSREDQKFLNTNTYNF